MIVWSQVCGNAKDKKVETKLVVAVVVKAMGETGTANIVAREITQWIFCWNLHDRLVPKHVLLIKLPQNQMLFHQSLLQCVLLHMSTHSGETVSWNEYEALMHEMSHQECFLFLYCLVTIRYKKLSYVSSSTRSWVIDSRATDHELGTPIPFNQLRIANGKSEAF